MDKILNLIILGPQGSGKGTQAALLARNFRAALFGAGDALREIAKIDTAIGRRVHQTINVEGRLVEPELISDVIKEQILTVPKEQSLILDSYPRSLEQYDLFKQFWPEMGRGDYLVIFLELSEAEAIKRLMQRKRVDDSEEIIRKRLQMFRSLTMPMIAEMEKEGKVIRIDGTPSIDKVQQQILEKLNLSPAAR